MRECIGQQKKMIKSVMQRSKEVGAYHKPYYNIQNQMKNVLLSEQLNNF